ncbi:MAG TPA: hypothetical protein VFG45_05910 [Candidatus Nitrosocosmicus sp.]|nr:hypothetical protein [Candidatus Nitrosocosmicus sp.]
MSYLSNPIVFTSDKNFMVRINSTLRKLGIIDIKCHKSWMEIGLRGEDVGVIIHYPENLDYLADVVEEEVRLQTQLFESNIQTIRYFVDENLEQIKQALNQIKRGSFMRANLLDDKYVLK